MRTHVVFNDYEFDIDINETFIKVYDSFKAKDDEVKQGVISILYDLSEDLESNRSLNSLINEWKVHNAFYNRNGKVDHTKDVDFEFKQKGYHKIIYFILSKILKE